MHVFCFCFYNDWFHFVHIVHRCLNFSLADGLVEPTIYFLLQTLRCDVGPSIARRALVCLMYFISHGKLFCSLICLWHLYHYASMHLWLKLFILRSCVTLSLKKIRWINHCLDCIYCCLNIWYHNGFIFGTNLHGHERWYHISAESICYEYW